MIVPVVISQQERERILAKVYRDLLSTPIRELPRPIDTTLMLAIWKWSSEEMATYEDWGFQFFPKKNGDQHRQYPFSEFLLASMAAKTAQIVSGMMEINNIYVHLALEKERKVLGRLLIAKSLVCIHTSYKYIYISKWLILKNKLQYICKIPSLDVWYSHYQMIFLNSITA